MRRALGEGALGLALAGAGLYALLRDVPFWNAIWYAPAWYGYLLIVDAAILARRGRSFVFGESRLLAAMLLWSIPFWFFFEACNLVLRDWYYVFALRDWWASALMSAVAFATVLPACFFHAELLAALGVWRTASCRAIRVGRGTLRAVEAGGMLSLVLPLAFSRVAFPLIWFAPIGLEAITYRNGGDSLLRDLEEGRCGRLWRLLAGGLWAGVIWELFNFRARCKWIYAVPGFEGSKLFEMPLAGFLGFPVLAVSAFSFFSFVQTRATGKGRRLLPVLAVLACIAIEVGMQRSTVRSRRPLLAELSGLDRASIARLERAGVATPERLVAAAERSGVGILSERAGVPADALTGAVSQARLALHKGMGAPAADLLEQGGIQNVAELALADAEELSRRLVQLAAALGKQPPTLAEVRVWVRAARASGGRSVP
jgi:hypothetical protein